MSAQQDILEATRRCFKQTDVNGDGKVDRQEFVKLCKMAGLGDHAYRLFIETDTSGDGTITEKELEDLVMKLSKDDANECQIRVVFKRFDKSGDGKLDQKEFLSALAKCGHDEKVLKELFDKVAGSDGVISVEEFLAAWK